MVDAVDGDDDGRNGMSSDFAESDGLLPFAVEAEDADDGGFNTNLPLLRCASPHESPVQTCLRHMATCENRHASPRAQPRPLTKSAQGVDSLTSKRSAAFCVRAASRAAFFAFPELPADLCAKRHESGLGHLPLPDDR